MRSRLAIGVAGVIITVAAAGLNAIAGPAPAAGAPTPAVLAAAATCKGTAPSDFNGDGISDVAIGEPHVGTGDVHVIYGTRSGLHADASGTAPNDQLVVNLLQQNSAGFGTAVVALDFNGDGCSDLAVGVPRSVLPAAVPPAAHPLALAAPGYVAIFLGSPSGLLASQDDINGLNAGVTTGTEDNFGAALAAGDINGDGKDDLVVGAPLADSDKGAIYVFPGVSNTSITGHRFLTGDGTIPAGDGGVDEFGSSLAVGDFNHDGRADVAAAAPRFASSAGIVDVVNGSATSPYLVSGSAVQWTQDTPGVAGTSEAGDRFGASLAVGDFRGDGQTDLAIGVPGEAIGSIEGAGQVNVLYSLGSGLTAAGNQAWNQNSSGISGTAESSDSFGFALAAGDFNGNGRDDLAVGVVGEAIGTQFGAGSVNILMGSSSVGLSSSGQKAFSQDTSGVAGNPELGDNFGASLTVGRIHSAGRDDLIVGVPGEGIGSIEGAGEIQLLPGSSSGPTASGSQNFDADTAGIKGVCTAQGNFGFALA
ncbi:MAG TPA: FG-GAP repeat protein [Micromonosporaceae bacterium]